MPNREAHRTYPRRVRGGSRLQKRVAQARPKEVWRIETVSVPPAPGPSTALNSEGPVTDFRGATMKAPVISLPLPMLAVKPSVK